MLAAMRSLLPIPNSALDPVTRLPRFGSYRGGLEHVDLTGLPLNPLQRVARHKRWFYIGIAKDPYYVGLAIVRLGYASTVFAFVFDRNAGALVAQTSTKGPSLAASVGDTASEGAFARFRLGPVWACLTRPKGSMSYALDARLPRLALHAELDCSNAPQSITAIAPVAPVNVTEKRALLTVRGEAIVDGRPLSLDGGLAAYDYTHGMLHRHTSWRWALALGTATTGERVGLNLVHGFVGEPECAVWVDNDVVAVSEGQFCFDQANPLAPWTVRTGDGAVDLRFVPGAMHSERTNLGILATRFVQPVGTYSGRLRVEGHGELTLDQVLGVAEDQEVRW